MYTLGANCCSIPLTGIDYNSIFAFSVATPVGGLLFGADPLANPSMILSHDRSLLFASGWVEQNIGRPPANIYARFLSQSDGFTTWSVTYAGNQYAGAGFFVRNDLALPENLVRGVPDMVSTVSLFGTIALLVFGVHRLSQQHESSAPIPLTSPKLLCEKEFKHSSIKVRTRSAKCVVRVHLLELSPFS